MAERFLYPQDPEKGELPELTLAKALSKDYRLSFKFSQGSARLQESLFALLGVLYTRQHQNNHLAALAAITDWYELSIPPILHQDKGVDEAHIQRESMAESEKFRYYLTHPDISLFADDPDLYGTIISETTERLLLRDLKYISENYLYIGNDRADYRLSYTIPRPDTNGRPRRVNRANRYTSYFKKYIIDSRPSGSNTFNSIFQDIRSYAQSFPHYYIGQLASAWELRHPGRSFYTADFRAPSYK